MQHTYTALYHGIKIRPLTKKDIENLRIWRNDIEQTKFLRPIGKISSEMQEKWFKDYLMDKNQIIFAIEETHDLHRLVGSLALYDFNETEAEIGKIQIGDKEAHGRGIGRKSLAMACKIGFEHLKLTQIIAFVHQHNIASHSNFDRLGFEKIGIQDSVVGGIEDKVSINYYTFKNVNSYVNDIII